MQKNCIPKIKLIWSMIPQMIEWFSLARAGKPNAPPGTLRVELLSQPSDEIGRRQQNMYGGFETEQIKPLKGWRLPF
jgi:hypothetical protein